MRGFATISRVLDGRKIMLKYVRKNTRKERKSMVCFWMARCSLFGNTSLYGIGGRAWDARTPYTRLWRTMIINLKYILQATRESPHFHVPVFLKLMWRWKLISLLVSHCNFPFRKHLLRKHSRNKAKTDKDVHYRMSALKWLSVPLDTQDHQG